MPEGEVLPKTGKARDWLDYADKKEKDFANHHSERNILGQIKHPGPLQDDYSKLLSNNALQARKMGMELLRKESGQTNTKAMQSYRKGGRVKEDGPARLHSGEAVARKPVRKSPRSKSR